MKSTSVYQENINLRIDQIVDARGVTFSKKLDYINDAMNHLSPGQTLTVYCSDIKNKGKIPQWLEQNGFIYLGMINHSNYYKIILIKT